MEFTRYRDTRKYYQYYQIKDFIEENKDLFSNNLKSYRKKSEKIKYYNLPVSFDIETTSFEDEELNEYSYCYLWNFDIYGYIFQGRSLREFRTFIDYLSEALELSNEKRLIVYVHNLPFEFQFIKDYYNWQEVFALDKYKPIKCLIDELGVEFRCSLKLSNQSLAVLSQSTQTKKLVGDLDYSLKRHSYTKIYAKENQYGINDTEVVVDYIEQQITEFGDLHKIPMTSTGKVRKNVKSYVLKSKKYKYTVQNIKINSVEEFTILKRAFTGGFTHANHNFVGEILTNVKSFDLSSSYPSRICASYFPMSNGKKVKIKSKRQFEYMLKNNCCIFEVTFKNINSKISFEHFLSYHKCYNLVNPTIDNGRVVGADELTVVLTEVDFNIVKKCYAWEKMFVGVFYSYKRGYLPKEFIEKTLEWYSNKTKLKGIPEQEKLYALSKTYINALYGCMVTSIDKPEYKIVDDKWIEEARNIEDILNDYNTNYSRFLCYQWGIYVTAHAKSILFNAILELKEDYVYSDTDSVKFLNYENHKEFFEQENEKIIESVRKMCDFYGIDFSKASPKTKNGIEKPLGVWEFDGDYKAFKTMGAKRYIYLDKKLNPHITIAGLGKIKGCEYLVNRYGKYGMFYAFNEGLYIDGETTGKLTHKYIEVDGLPIIKQLTDYQGLTTYIEVNSCVYLTGAPFSLSLNSLFKDYLLNSKNEVLGI